MNFSWDVFWQYLLRPSDIYLYGLWLTCVIAVGAMLLGCVLGLLAALMRLSTACGAASNGALANRPANRSGEAASRFTISLPWADGGARNPCVRSLPAA